jgi:ABC-type Fe3+ transport system permease subunit
MSGLRPLRPGEDWEDWYAYLYLSALLLLPLLAALIAVLTGIVQVDATVTVSPDLSTPVRWLVQGLVVIFLFWTFVQIIRVTGIGFIQGLIQSIARIADSYELPGEPEQTESLSEAVEGPGDSESEGGGGGE